MIFPPTSIYSIFIFSSLTWPRLNMIWYLTFRRTEPNLSLHSEFVSPKRVVCIFQAGCHIVICSLFIGIEWRLRTIIHITSGKGHNEKKKANADVGIKFLSDECCKKCAEIRSCTQSDTLSQSHDEVASPPRPPLSVCALLQWWRSYQESQERPRHSQLATTFLLWFWALHYYQVKQIKSQIYLILNLLLHQLNLFQIVGIKVFLVSAIVTQR